MAKATFAAGCFWGVEAAFSKIEGVGATRVGYTGGHAEQPDYRQVCGDTTGHAEAVEIDYDPAQISYPDLLEVFWRSHDPTQFNRQGPDIGTQYRSAIFYHNDDQRSDAVAAKIRRERDGTYRDPIVTEILPAGTFWEAEEHHQQYFETQGRTSCRLPSQPNDVGIDGRP